MLWVQAHPSQPGWMSHTMGDEAPQGIPWIPTWKYRVGMLLPQKSHICTQPHRSTVLWMHLRPLQGLVLAHLHHLGSHLHHLGSHLPGRICNGQLWKLPLAEAKLPLLQVTHPLKQHWI